MGRAWRFCISLWAFCITIAVGIALQPRAETAPLWWWTGILAALATIIASVEDKPHA